MKMMRINPKVRWKRVLYNCVFGLAAGGRFLLHLPQLDLKTLRRWPIKFGHLHKARL